MGTQHMQQQIDQLKETNSQQEQKIKQLEEKIKKLIQSKSISEEADKLLNNITADKIILSLRKVYKKELTQKLEKEKDEFLLKNEKFKTNIEAYKEKALDKSIKQFLTQTKHINIILLGKTGVGKSTLINAILGKDKAIEGGFTPVTKETNYYEADHLRLYDTVGIELSEKRNAEQVLNNVKSLINDSEKKNPDWFIHCIWYCISGCRFEEEKEGPIIEQLSKTYKDGKMPIIIAYLQAFNKKELYTMKNGINIKYPNFDFIPIIAKEIETINGVITPPSGLDEIKRKTIFNFGDSNNSMSFVYVQNKAIQLVLENVENLTGSKDLINLSKSVCDLYKKIIGELNEKDKNKIEEDVKTMKEWCKENIDFKDEIVIIIEKFKKDLSKEGIDKAELKKVVEKMEKELEERYDKCKREQKFDEEIYNYFLERIKKEAKTIVMDSLKNIKMELKNMLTNAINKSPNFQELLKNE